MPAVPVSEGLLRHEAFLLLVYFDFLGKAHCIGLVMVILNGEFQDRRQLVCAVCRPDVAEKTPDQNVGLKFPKSLGCHVVAVYLDVAFEG